MKAYIVSALAMLLLGAIVGATSAPPQNAPRAHRVTAR
jgi:hypothetical protein